MMSNDGLIIETMDLSHIHLAVLHGNMKNETDTEIYYYFQRFHDSSTGIIL